MSGIAMVWLGYECHRLLWRPAHLGGHTVLKGGIDLMLRQWEVNAWFAGRPVYQEIRTAANPPAAQLLLWPFLGWLSVRHAVWLWLATTTAALAWLVRMIVRESGAETRLQRVFVCLIPLGMYATGACIGNGQLTIPVVALVVASILRLRREQISWRNDATVAAMMILALSKPNLSAPFFLLILLVPCRLRPAALVVFGYGVVSLFSAFFQPGGPVAVFSQWAAASAALSARMATRSVQYNVHAILAAFGCERWDALASLVVFGLLGLWIGMRRSGATWVLLGVVGVATFFWTYHGWYDDLVLLPAMIALYQIALGPRSSKGSATVARYLLAAMICVTLAPGGRYLLPSPWNQVVGCLQAGVVLAVLVFLAVQRTPRAGFGAVADRGCPG
jgi:hypothetical protein